MDLEIVNSEIVVHKIADGLVPSLNLWLRDGFKESIIRDGQALIKTTLPTDKGFLDKLGDHFQRQYHLIIKFF